MTGWGRNLLAGLLIVLLALGGPPAAEAQLPGPYPEAGTKAQQWKHITGLSAQAFAIKASEAGLSGEARKNAFKKRTMMFFHAADALRDYVGQHFQTAEVKRSRGYLYAAFTGGLYWENSGDIWRARSWYYEADKYRALLAEQGIASPNYNGVAIGTLLPVRLDRTVKLANLSGGVHPVTFKMDILFSEGDEHRAATAFLLENDQKISDLYGHANPSMPDERVELSDAP